MVTIPTHESYASKARRREELEQLIRESFDPVAAYISNMDEIAELPDMDIEYLMKIRDTADELIKEENELKASFGEGFANINRLKEK